MRILDYKPPKVRNEDAMTKSQKRVFRLLVTIGMLMTIAFGIWWFWPTHLPNNFSGWAHAFDFLIFAVLSLTIWHQIAGEILLWQTARDMKHPYSMKPKPGSKVAFLTAFVPGNEPYDVLEGAFKSMVAVDYPHDSWVLDEGNDAIVKQMAKKYGVKYHSRYEVEKYHQPGMLFATKTKGGNLNSWYDQYAWQYDFVAQMDNDFRPAKNFLTMKLGYFNDPDVAFVSSPQIYGNVNNSLVAAGAAEQQYSFYGPVQKGLYGSGMVLPIGSHHIMRSLAIKDINGYACHLAEDHLTGMMLYTRDNWKSVYVPEVLAIGEGPSSWDAYFGQQKRWAFALMDILFKKSPKLLPKMRPKHAINYFLLQLHYFYGFMQVLGVALMSLYLFFGIKLFDMQMIAGFCLMVALFLWQFLITLWLQRFYIDPETESGFLLKGKLVSLACWPVYAGAFFDFIRGKKFSYTITPKGEQDQTIPMALFRPHFILGTITALGLVVALRSGHTSALILAFAILNTVVMYSFVVYALANNAAIYLNQNYRSGEENITI